ncbi:MAG: poly-gamma-glutamate hydrolase family protein [Nitrososphaeraceae archaeon]
MDKNSDDLLARLELSSADLSSADHFPGKVNAQVTAVGLTDAEAEESSEFIEKFADNGHNHGLIVIAPHGGNIKKYTNEQAEHVGQKLSSEYDSQWVCKGSQKGGGAFAHWHITSTEISEESFPMLKTIMRRDFEYSVAFYGWGEKSTCIGGTMPSDLICEIKKTITKVVPDSIEVKDGGCPEGFNGNNPENIVNRLSTKDYRLNNLKKPANVTELISPMRSLMSLDL